MPGSVFTYYLPVWAVLLDEPVVKPLVFVLISVVAVYFSRRSIFAPRSHGFYRFFAWECILGLFVLNFNGFDAWFGDPFSAHQIVSWVLLIASIFPVVEGTRLLRKEGRRMEEREDDASLLGFEKTTRLVTTGIFGYIRHPMYSSLVLLAWGIFFKWLSIPGAILAAAASVLLFITARVEEQEDIRFFGPSYVDYMKGTKRFLPFVF